MGEIYKKKKTFFVPLTILVGIQGISETNDQMLRNVCWHEPERELYTEVNPESGEVTGFDMDLLADIVRMYLIQPTVDTIPNQVITTTKGDVGLVH